MDVKKMSALLALVRAEQTSLIPDFESNFWFDFLVERICRIADEACDMHPMPGSSLYLSPRGVQAREKEMHELVARNRPALEEYLRPYIAIEQSAVLPTTSCIEVHRYCVAQMLAGKF